MPSSLPRSGVSVAVQSLAVPSRRTSKTAASSASRRSAPRQRSRKAGRSRRRIRVVRRCAAGNALDEAPGPITVTMARAPRDATRCPSRRDDEGAAADQRGIEALQEALLGEAAAQHLAAGQAKRLCLRCRCADADPRGEGKSDGVPATDHRWLRTQAISCGGDSNNGAPV